MRSHKEEIIIHYSREWEYEYRTTGFVSKWRYDFPELFADYKGSTRIGTLDLFPQYALMYLLRRDQRIESLTWYNLASRPERSKNRQRTLKYWSIMKKHMGGDIFDSLRNALLANGFEGFTGEPDLFCWQPETDEWFFAEAKRKDVLTDSERRWLAVAREVLGEGCKIRLYRLKPFSA